MHANNLDPILGVSKKINKIYLIIYKFIFIFYLMAKKPLLF